MGKKSKFSPLAYLMVHFVSRANCLAQMALIRPPMSRSTIHYPLSPKLGNTHYIPYCEWALKYLYHYGNGCVVDITHFDCSHRAFEFLRQRSDIPAKC